MVQGSAAKSPPASAGDTGDSGLIPGSGRSPGGGHGDPLQYSCLENPMVRGAWWATVHGVTKGQTQVSKHLLPSDLLTFPLIFFFYSRIPFSTLYYIYSTYLLWLLMARTVDQNFYFLMTLTVLSSTNQECPFTGICLFFS